MSLEAALIKLGTAAVSTAAKLWLGDHVRPACCPRTAPGLRQVDGMAQALHLEGDRSTRPRWVRGDTATWTYAAGCGGRSPRVWGRRDLSVLSLSTSWTIAAGVGAVDGRSLVLSSSASTHVTWDFCPNRSGERVNSTHYSGSGSIDLCRRYR
jgi:hypothetical protein